MSRLVIVLVAILTFALGGCAPQVSGGQQAAERVLVFPGGWIKGRWVYQGNDVFSLPAKPTDADASGLTLGVVYEYSWQLYQDGQLTSETPLPYPALSLHARPAWVVVLNRGLYTRATGWLDYPALDAVNTDDGLYWVNEEGLWQGGRRLLAGEFERVLALGNRILSLGRDRGVYWPNREEIVLPPDWTAADAGNDLYLLVPAGLLRYDPGGFELGLYPGSFTDLAVGEDGGVWLAAADGRVIHLTPELEEAW
ncbi:hypothetical protein [Oceanithermus sp.]